MNDFSGWIKISDVLPDTGFDCYVVWNGTFWQKASLLNVYNKGIVFCDSLERPIKGATHYKFVGVGPNKGEEK